MSGRSWGHSITPLQRVHNFYGIPCRCSTTIGRGSKRQHCQDPARYEVSYGYISGQRGRTTSNRRQACAAHAQTFANKHDLTLPAVPLLHLHNWQPGQAYAGVEQCSRCGLYRTRDKNGLGLFSGYSCDSDLSVCTPREAAA